MAITIDWPTKIFSVPQADLTFISGTLYELDTEAGFRQIVNALMDNEEGIVFEDPISHNTQYSVAGVTYARKIEMINSYKIQFTPNSQWTVRLAGSNNNLFDVENGILVQNQVQVIPQNSAGLAIPTLIEIVKKMIYNDAVKAGDIVTIKEDNGVDTWEQFDVSSGGRVKQ